MRATESGSIRVVRETEPTMKSPNSGKFVVLILLASGQELAWDGYFDTVEGRPTKYFDARPDTLVAQVKEFCISQHPPIATVYAGKIA
jgi:hypothetical protein